MAFPFWGDTEVGKKYHTAHSYSTHHQMFLHLKEHEDGMELPAWQMLKPECSASLSFIGLSGFFTTDFRKAGDVTAFWYSGSFPWVSPSRVTPQTSGDNAGTWIALHELATFTLHAVTVCKNERIKQAQKEDISWCKQLWLRSNQWMVPDQTDAEHTVLKPLRSPLGPKPYQKPRGGAC